MSTNTSVNANTSIGIGSSVIRRPNADNQFSTEFFKSNKATIGVLGPSREYQSPRDVEYARKFNRFESEYNRMSRYTLK